MWSTDIRFRWHFHRSFGSTIQHGVNPLLNFFIPKYNLTIFHLNPVPENNLITLNLNLALICPNRLCHPQQEPVEHSGYIILIVKMSVMGRIVITGMFHIPMLFCHTRDRWRNTPLAVNWLITALRDNITESVAQFFCQRRHRS